MDHNLARMRLTERGKTLIARCIGELEARTEAEVVLVLKQKSGNYRDVSYLVGAIAAFLALCIALYSPWEIHPLALPMPILAVFCSAGWLCQRSRLRVWLTSSKRRNEQVSTAAAAAFYDKGIFRTACRTGILLYYSRFEREARILCDRESLHRLDADRLEEYRQELASIDKSKDLARALGTFVRSFGLYLGRALPWDASARGVKRDDLSDEPDVTQDAA